MKKIDVRIRCLGALFFIISLGACSVESIPADKNELESYPTKEIQHKKKNDFFTPLTLKYYTVSEIFYDEKILAFPCERTDFANVLSGYIERLMRDPFFDIELVNYYSELNKKYVTFYRGENYYGANGEYNQLAKKRIRELTNFWGLNRELMLNGQHTASLNDREILTDMIESFDRTVRNRTEAYAKADELLELNSLSPNFPENPFFAIDAFTNSNGLLVIGDGLLETLIEVGIDGKIAFTAILAHEWWHQAQFEFADEWTYIDQLSTPAEKSRFSELEADFAAAYFLTHKRGATYNWKRIDDYFSLSFNVGDCLSQSSQHHGTPNQRLAAAELGYELAAVAQKKGFILSPMAVHNYFVDNYEKVLGN